MKVLFSTYEFNGCDTIADIKARIENSDEMIERIERLMSMTGCAMGDAIEGVASHIAYTDEDYTI